MLELPIPIANSPADIKLGKRATDKAWTPGFLMTPEAVTHAIGRSVFEVTGMMSDEQRDVPDPELVRTLSPLVCETLGISIDSPNSSIWIARGDREDRHRPPNSHIDSDYEGGVFHLSGGMPAPRTIELSTVYGEIPHRGLPLAESLPFYCRATTIFRGQLEEGWAAYFLAKDPHSEARTAHRFVGPGLYARFGDKSAEGLELCRRANEAIELVEAILRGEEI